jgi:hypothetical protein
MKPKLTFSAKISRIDYVVTKYIFNGVFVLGEYGERENAEREL